MDDTKKQRLEELRDNPTRSPQEEEEYKKLVEEEKNGQKPGGQSGV
jgi:hypothetical protein